MWNNINSCGEIMQQLIHKRNCDNCVSLCNRSVEQTEVISLNTIVFPVIKSNLIPIVPHKGSVEQLPATVFVLKVKGEVLTKYH